MLAAAVSCLVVARLARSLLAYCYRPGGVRGWWRDIGASALLLIPAAGAMQDAGSRDETKTLVLLAHVHSLSLSISLSLSHSATH